MRFITAILTLASMFGTAASLGAQDIAAPDSEQQDSQSQTYSEGSPGQDPQAEQQRAVARLSIAQGDVNVKRGDSGDLVAAVVNAPLLVQDHVQTSTGSRAEIQLDYANMIRLAPNTDIGFADLAYHRYQVQLGAGSIIYRVLRDSDAQAEIDTPSVAVRPTQQGDYRISVLDDGSTEITVRSGELEVYSPKGTEQLQAGRSMLVRGDSSDPEFQMADQPPLDQFDEWSANRDRTLLASQSYQHVSRDIYGADDLDAYGNWVPSQYGNVWAPRSVGADWAPYSTGHWVWEDYYGWTWVDDAPWGWAPYHYGRWFDNPGYGWCWWPGSVASSYFWSPALVGFFGWGGGGFSVGFGVGWGSIGWVALAPFEAFHPWWGGGYYGGGFGGNYTNININNVNIVRNTNITNIYRNASKKGAVMTTHGSDFGRGGSARFGRATPVQLRNANLFRGRVPVTPTQASRQFTSRQATPNPRLAAAANRRFYQSPQFAQSARAASARQQVRTQPGSRVAGNTSQVARAGGFARAGQPGSNSAQREAQRGQTPAISRGSAPRTPQNSRTGAGISAGSQQSLHGIPPNTRSQAGGRSNLGTPAQASTASGWHRFGETGAQRGQAPAMSRNTGPRAPQNPGNRANVGSAPRESFHGMPPNMRSQTGGRNSFSPSTQSSAAGWHRFGEPGSSTGPRNATQAREQSGWHNFGQPERAGSATYGGARSGNAQAQPRYSRSLNAPNAMPNYGGNYQSRPLGANPPAARPPQSSFGYRGGSSYGPRPSYAAPNYGGMGSSRNAPPSMPRYSAPSAPRYSAPSMPHYSAPSAPHYSAPSMPHYSAPSPRGGGGGGFHGSAPSGGGSRGGHSSSDGRRSR